MKQKLKIFTDFIQSLYPDEVLFVANSIKSEDTQVIQILSSLKAGVATGKYQFETEIDKRKYSALKTRISTLLAATDIDNQISEIHFFTQKILKDDIAPADEERLLQIAKVSGPDAYYFREYYRMFLKLRDFLTIRLRKKLLPEVEAYLEHHFSSYQLNQEVENQIPDLTHQIIEEYELKSVTNEGVANTLLEISKNIQLDGHNRYTAAVRLWFYYLNKGEYTSMLRHMEEFRSEFLLKSCPGKRVLSNYYANRLLVHSKLNQLEDALYYGKLSLMYKTSDHLFYLTNLSAILSRMGRSQEAYKLMLSAFDEMRTTSNQYNKISFIAQYIHILIDLKRYKQAEEFAENYLHTAIKEVFATRWHLFFAGFFRSLVMQEKFGRLLYIVGKYKIKQLEAEYRRKPNYLPTMSWYITLAEFMEGYLSEEKALDSMAQSASVLMSDPIRRQRISEQCNILFKFQPDMIRKLKKRLEIQ
ncbi:hypothetical protein [Schleiferia thermophila]|uniref:Tetratricopeptide repeat protein n=1 Tax=Schleiferia thermophila TaxID=884107 RepID=A0A369A2G1_9FLAO|nr:hypothetical protein [Schleiferia thermophila]RCX03375.1 hypothetical protein DES35_103260 [Schleiferia thermophila]GCD80504.1 hypothetical protein JCM30197_17510 [Schleiferia thermophila]